MVQRRLCCVLLAGSLSSVLPLPVFAQIREEPPILYSPVSLPPTVQPSEGEAQAAIEQQSLALPPPPPSPAAKSQARPLKAFPEPPTRIDLATLDIRDEDRAVLSGHPVVPSFPVTPLAIAAGVGVLLLLRLRKHTNRSRFTNGDPLEPMLDASESHRASRSAPPWSLALLQEIEWKRFEDVVAAYFRELGYSTQTQSHGADGGVDIWLHEEAKATLSGVVQCKAWGTKITVKVIRELLGVMVQHRVGKGYVFCTSGFTFDAMREAERGGLILVDGKAFLRRIQCLPVATQERLRRLATEGDYKTPSCANCGRKLVLTRVRGIPCWVCQKPFCNTRIFARRQL